ANHGAQRTRPPSSLVDGEPNGSRRASHDANDSSERSTGRAGDKPAANDAHRTSRRAAPAPTENESRRARGPSDNAPDAPAGRYRWRSVSRLPAPAGKGLRGAAARRGSNYFRDKPGLRPSA